MLDRADNLSDPPPGAGRKQAAAQLLAAFAELEQEATRMESFRIAAAR